MKFGKRLCAFVLSAVMLLASVPAVSAANGTIIMNLGSNVMTVNGNTVAIDVDPAIKPQVHTVNGYGYTMLPLRAVVESMGGQVYYDIATKNITMLYEGTTVTHVIGTSTAYVNGTARELAIASYAANNRTYVHLRAIELLSSSIAVNWNANDRNRVEIVYPQNAPVTILPDAPVIIDPGTTENETIDILLTFHNEMDAKLVELHLAPAGTENYGENLLSRAINAGTAKDFDLKLVPGEYDVLGVDDDGDEYEWEDVELEKEELYLWLIDDGEYELTDDEDEEFGAGENTGKNEDKDEGEYSTNIRLTNTTNETIEEIWIFHADDDSDDAKCIVDDTIQHQGSAYFTLDYDPEEPMYCFIAVFADGDEVEYDPIDLSGKNRQIFFLPSERLQLAWTTPKGEVFFRNETGATISDLRIKTGQGTFSLNQLTNTVGNGKTVELSRLTPAYVVGCHVEFMVGSDDDKVGAVNVSINKMGDILFVMDEDYELRVSDGTGDDGDLLGTGMYLKNCSNEYFDRFYVINGNEVDPDDFDLEFDDAADYFRAVDDYDPADYYESKRNFKDKSTIHIDQWDADELQRATLYFKAESGSSKYYGELKLRKSDTFEYNIYIELDVSIGEVEAEIVEIDCVESDGGGDPVALGVRIYNGTSGGTIEEVRISFNGGKYERLDLTERIKPGKYTDTKLTIGDLHQSEIQLRFYLRESTLTYYTDIEDAGNLSNAEEVILVISDPVSANADYDLQIEKT